VEQDSSLSHLESPTTVTKTALTAPTSAKGVTASELIYATWSLFQAKVNKINYVVFSVNSSGRRMSLDCLQPGPLSASPSEIKQQYTSGWLTHTWQHLESPVWDSRLLVLFHISQDSITFPVPVRRLEYSNVFPNYLEDFQNIVSWSTSVTRMRHCFGAVTRESYISQETNSSGRSNSKDQINKESTMRNSR
jgi:hypothetical protein